MMAVGFQEAASGEHLKEEESQRGLCSHCRSLISLHVTLAQLVIFPDSWQNKVNFLLGTDEKIDFYTFF